MPWRPQAVPRLLLETMFIAGLVALIVVDGRRDHRAADSCRSSAFTPTAGFRLVPTAHRIGQQISSLRWTLAASESIASGPPSNRSTVSAATRRSGRLDSAFRERIQRQGISFTYEGAVTPVLKDVSLSVARLGNRSRSFGGTGAGKTTLLDILIGLLRHQPGRSRSTGCRSTARSPAWQANIGYIPPVAIPARRHLAAQYRTRARRTRISTRQALRRAV